MTLEEARSHIGQSVLHSDFGAEAEYAVIARVLTSHVYVRRRRDDRFMSARPEDLTLPGEQAAEARADSEPTASRAALNEYVALMIMGEACDEFRYADAALTALQQQNFAAGYDFLGEAPPGDSDERQRCEGRMVDAVKTLEALSRLDARRAKREAERLARMSPEDAAQERLPGLRPDAPALVYLVTHGGYGAAKVGVTEISGSRLAQHRREGWRILAVFQVSVKSAAAIETDVLKWWRGSLGLPSYLTRNQMPQGGWTETVAAGRIDLAATVMRICNLAIQQDARPGRSQSGRPASLQAS